MNSSPFSNNTDGITPKTEFLDFSKSKSSPGAQKKWVFYTYLKKYLLQTGVFPNIAKEDISKFSLRCRFLPVYEWALWKSAIGNPLQYFWLAHIKSTSNTDDQVLVWTKGCPSAVANPWLRCLPFSKGSEVGPWQHLLCPALPIDRSSK